MYLLIMSAYVMNRCWLRSDNYFIWSFLGPVGAIITVRVCASIEMVFKLKHFIHCVFHTFCLS